MIRTLLRLQVKPGAAENLVHAFQSQQILELSVAQDGCLGAELCVSADGTEVIVTALWVDHEAYGRWTERTDRGDMSTELNPHLVQPVTSETIGMTYTVAHAP